MIVTPKQLETKLSLMLLDALELSNETQNSGFLGRLELIPSIIHDFNAYEAGSSFTKLNKNPERTRDFMEWNAWLIRIMQKTMREKEFILFNIILGEDIDYLTDFHIDDFPIVADLIVLKDLLYSSLLEKISPTKFDELLEKIHDWLDSEGRRIYRDRLMFAPEESRAESMEKFEQHFKRWSELTDRYWIAREFENLNQIR